MQSLNAAVPGAVVELLRNSPVSPGKIDFVWRLAVGPKLAKVSAVRLESTTLLVDVQSGQWGRELHRSAAMVLRRLQKYLGSDVVTGMTVRTPNHRT